MTRVELDNLFRHGAYIRDWNQDEHVPAANRGNRMNRLRAHEDQPLHMHGSEAQATVRHGYGPPVALEHRWRFAGAGDEHLGLFVTLDHHSRHFHGASHFGWELYIEDNGEDGTHYYRNLDAWGLLQDGNSTDGWEAYEMIAHYEYRYCALDWICLSSWTSYTKRKTCVAGRHQYWYSRHCYVAN